MKDPRYYEVEMQFSAPTGAVVPVTASSEEEAREIVEHLFKDHKDLKIVKITDITSQPATPLLN